MVNLHPNLGESYKRVVYHNIIFIYFVSNTSRSHKYNMIKKSLIFIQLPLLQCGHSTIILYIYIYFLWILLQYIKYTDECNADAI